MFLNLKVCTLLGAVTVFLVSNPSSLPESPSHHEKSVLSIDKYKGTTVIKLESTESVIYAKQIIWSQGNSNVVIEIQEEQLAVAIGSTEFSIKGEMLFATDNRMEAKGVVHAKKTEPTRDDTN